MWRKEQPANFVLRLEFRWDKGNSGVQVRSDDLGELADLRIPGRGSDPGKNGPLASFTARWEAPEKETATLDGDSWPTGNPCLRWREDGQASATMPARSKKHFKDHEWNTMEIIAQGDTLVQKINGVVFSSLTDR